MVERALLREDVLVQEDGKDLIVGMVSISATII